MKRFIIILLVSLCSAVSVFSQGGKPQTFHLVYVYHSQEINVDEICKHLTNLYKDARFKDAPTLFYMPNMSTPFMVFVDKSHDSAEGFETIIRELQERRYHSADLATDLNSLLDFFNNRDFVSERGDLIYPRMEWAFYVNKAYWTDVSAVISKLAYILDLDKYYTEENFRLSVSYSGESISIDNDYPFGELNLCPLLNRFDLMLF